MINYSLSEELRLRKEFSDKISNFGLELDDMLYHVSFDADFDSFVLRLKTKIYPLAGNSSLVKVLKFYGFDVTVFTPYGWGKRKAFYVSEFHLINLK